MNNDMISDILHVSFKNPWNFEPSLQRSQFVSE